MKYQPNKRSLTEQISKKNTRLVIVRLLMIPSLCLALSACSVSQVANAPSRTASQAASQTVGQVAGPRAGQAAGQVAAQAVERTPAKPDVLTAVVAQSPAVQL